MRYGIRIVAALCLVALLVPVAAVAKDARVQGPAVLLGAGWFVGELELTLDEGQRPVRILGGSGHIGVLDLGGDLKVRCPGRRVQEQETEAGTVFTCAGRGRGTVVLLGSHFKFRGHTARYQVHLPAGASGTFHGRFVVRGQGGEPARDDGGERRRPQPEPVRGDG